MAAILSAISYHYLKQLGKVTDLSKVYIEEEDLSPEAGEQLQDSYDSAGPNKFRVVDLISKFFFSKSSRRATAYLNIEESEDIEIRVRDIDFEN